MITPVVDPALLNTGDPPPQWVNLGFWRDTDAYSVAAAELARRVGRAIHLGPADVVLDLACGHGDSLAMWVREFGVSRAVGVEPDPALVVDVTARMRGLGLGDRVVLRSERAEYVVPRLAAPGTTAVVCVDAAYHFETRAAWLKALARDLPKGARLGLADLLVTTRALRRRRSAAAAAWARIPTANLWTAHDVEPTLADAGFRVERMVRCGHAVLGGFARHVLGRAPRLLRRPSQGGWRALGTAAAVGWADARAWLDYAIIAAVRV